MIKIIAVLCSISSPTDCHELTVATSDDISLMSCMMGAPQIAEWMKDYPDKRLAKWKCVIGTPSKEI